MQMCNTIKKKWGAKHHLNVQLLNKRVLTASMDWSSTILQSKAPTNESPGTSCIRCVDTESIYLSMEVLCSIKYRYHQVLNTNISFRFSNLVQFQSSNNNSILMLR